jgi:hypothetical protein
MLAMPDIQLTRRCTVMIQSALTVWQIGLLPPKGVNGGRTLRSFIDLCGYCLQVGCIRSTTIVSCRQRRQVLPDSGCSVAATVWHIVKECARTVGIAKSAPHDLRRTCAALPRFGR